MDLVIDANIVFAALVRDGMTIELFLEPELRLFCPEFLFEEIEKHRGELFAKMKRSPEELDGIFLRMKQKLIIIPREEFESRLEEACGISPDPDDVVYFALALQLDIPIWSNDKRLKAQHRVKIYSTEELL